MATPPNYTLSPAVVDTARHLAKETGAEISVTQDIVIKLVKF
jgi:ornithine carbamoyltransferase